MATDAVSDDSDDEDVEYKGSFCFGVLYSSPVVPGSVKEIAVFSPRYG